MKYPSILSIVALIFIGCSSQDSVAPGPWVTSEYFPYQVGDSILYEEINDTPDFPKTTDTIVWMFKRLVVLDGKTYIHRTEKAYTRSGVETTCYSTYLRAEGPKIFMRADECGKIGAEKLGLDFDAPIDPASTDKVYRHEKDTANVVVPGGTFTQGRIMASSDLKYRAIYAAGVGKIYETGQHRLEHFIGGHIAGKNYP